MRFYLQTGPLVPWHILYLATPFNSLSRTPHFIFALYLWDPPTPSTAPYPPYCPPSAYPAPISPADLRPASPPASDPPTPLIWERTSSCGTSCPLRSRDRRMMGAGRLSSRRRGWSCPLKKERGCVSWVEWWRRRRRRRRRGGVSVSGCGMPFWWLEELWGKEGGI